MNDYSDNFLTYVYDFNGDGWADIIVYDTPGADAYWYENPHGKKNADENAPSRKYFSADSCEAKRRRRESPAIKYNGSESISRATNKVMRSLEIGNKSIPATANRVSG